MERIDADDLAARILTAALDEAEVCGWDNVRLRKIAGELGISLADVNRHYPDLDAVSDAWFRQAWRAMLAPMPQGFEHLHPRERVQILMLRWFDALAPRRNVTIEMLKIKLWPFHPHHWVPMIFNLSRTIIWIRDAASLDAAGFRRAVEEVGMTWLFIATLVVWVRDETSGARDTRTFLNRRLNDANCILRMCMAPTSVHRNES